MQPDVSHLPESAQRLVALIGLQAAVLLIERHGGKEMTLYVRGDSVARLAASIGDVPTDALLRHFGSDPFNVPRCTAALKSVRNSRMQAEYDRLTSTERTHSGREAIHYLVENYGLTERQVWRILKTIPKMPVVDQRQMSLI